MIESGGPGPDGHGHPGRDGGCDSFEAWSRFGPRIYGTWVCFVFSALLKMKQKEKQPEKQRGRDG